MRIFKVLLSIVVFKSMCMIAAESSIVTTLKPRTHQECLELAHLSRMNHLVENLYSRFGDAGLVVAEYLHEPPGEMAFEVPAAASALALAFHTPEQHPRCIGLVGLLLTDDKISFNVVTDKNVVKVDYSISLPSSPLRYSQVTELCKKWRNELSCLVCPTYLTDISDWSDDKYTERRWEGDTKKILKIIISPDKSHVIGRFFTSECITGLVPAFQVYSALQRSKRKSSLE